VQTWTVYDGANPYADFDGSGALTHRYLYGQALDQLFARVDGDGSSTVWYLSDRQGSVRQLATTDGAVLDALTYDSYGNILDETNPENGDRFKYTGREYDAVLGMYYYRARYYAPGVGCFVSEDPLGFAGGDTNLYRYVHNRPTNATDPTGTTDAPATPRGPEDLVPVGIGAGGRSLVPYFHDPDLLPPPRPALDVIVELLAGVLFPFGGRGGRGRPPRVGPRRGPTPAPRPPRPATPAPTAPVPGWTSTQTGTTRGNAAILRRNLGIPRRSGLDAHHIVESTGSRAQPARDILDRYQIDINDAANGVALPPTGPRPAHHGHGLHSHAGIDAVTRRLERAIDGVDDWATARQRALDTLAAIRNDILAGTFP
jgi:RHS repeat-associated protein